MAPHRDAKLQQGQASSSVTAHAKLVPTDCHSMPHQHKLY